MLLGEITIRSVGVRTAALCAWLLSGSIACVTAQDGSVPTPPPNTSNAATVPASPPAAAQAAPTGTAMGGSPLIPSLENPGGVPRNAAPKPLQDFSLPKNAGQQWVEYDIRPFTKNVKGFDKPQQWLIDWIIRETGTDSWFHEPFGVLSGDRDTLRVYHTPEMQKKVAAIYEKFVNGATEPQIFGVRIITVANPHWRARAFGLMRSVPSESAGVSAWLMPKENGAIFLAQLRERGDAKELQAVEVPLHNGQLQHMEQLRSRNYLKEFVRNPAVAFPPYQPVTDEIREGFKLQISPLLSLDGRTADLLLQCEIDQVERLNPVKIDLPLGPNQSQPVQIEVPQVVSWRLRERFVWPTDQVLLLSCGVVATPSGPVDNTLTGNPPTLFGLNRIIPPIGQRNDALLWIEYKGTASNHLAPPSSAAQPVPGNNAQQATNPISRGRY